MGTAIRQVLDVHYMDHVADIARLGGDEFIMAFYAKDQMECKRIIDHLYDCLNHTPIVFEDKTIYGVFFRLAAGKCKNLNKDIDHLMYQAKSIEDCDHYLFQQVRID